MKEKKNLFMTAGHRILTVLGIILSLLLGIIIIINCTLIIKQYIDKDRVPTFGGIFPMIVMSDSMKGTFDSESLLVCQTARPEEIEKGDIICYRDPAGSGITTTTHRVVDIEKDIDGELSFITKGDANNANDQTPVPAENLIGIYKFHIAGLGALALFMQSMPGLIIFVILPIMILVSYDMIRRQIYDRKKNTDTDALISELEALRAEKAALRSGMSEEGDPLR
jgi:signal peptidase I